MIKFIIKITENNNYLTQAFARMATDLGLNVDMNSTSRKGKPSFAVGDRTEPHGISVGTSKHWDVAGNTKFAFYDKKYPNVERYDLATQWVKVRDLLIQFKNEKYPPAPVVTAPVVDEKDAKIAALEAQLAALRGDKQTTAPTTKTETKTPVAAPTPKANSSSTSNLNVFVIAEAARIKKLKKGLGSYVVAKAANGNYVTYHVDKAPAVNEGNLKTLFNSVS